MQPSLYPLRLLQVVVVHVAIEVRRRFVHDQERGFGGLGIAARSSTASRSNEG